MPLKILILVSHGIYNQLNYKKLESELSDCNFTVVDTNDSFLEKINDNSLGVICLSVTDNQLNPYDMLKIMESRNIATPLILVCSKEYEPEALKLMDAGFKDYITYDNFNRFYPAIRRELKYLENQNEKLIIENDLKHLNTELSKTIDERLTLFAEVNDSLINEIDARVKAEAETKKALEKERDLNMLKTRFISMISHEFRTPLTSIMLSADLLKRYGDNWEQNERMKHFDRIQNTVLNMTQLMENVLTIGRMESGKFEVNPEKIDLTAFCQSVVDSVEFMTNHTGRIEFLDKTSNISAIVDETLLGLILTNLLSNALKYSPNETKIHFDLENENGSIIMKVMDKGIGIPAEDLDHLFNTFYRASNTGSTAGYGIGLSIVSKCVEAHKGKIFVDSKLNEGTTFTVVLPTNEEFFT